LSHELKYILKNNKIQNYLVNHNSFSPRSIEFITSSIHDQEFTATEFEKFVLINFDRPDKIWRHAYEQQINDIDRFLLNTMLSFGDSVHYLQIENAFDARLNYEATYNNYQKPVMAFRNSFQRLENGFIIEENHNSGFYTFINPSLVDFLISHIRTSLDEVTRISDSVFYINQLLVRIFPVNGVSLKHYPSAYLQQRIISKYKYFIKNESKDEDCFNVALFVYYYIQKNEKFIIDRLSEIDNWICVVESYENKTNLNLFLKSVESQEIVELIRTISNRILTPVLVSEQNLEDALTTLNIFEVKYHVIPKDILDKGLMGEIESHFEDLLNENIEECIGKLLTYSFAQDFVDEEEQLIIKIQDSLLQFGIKTSANLSLFSDYDWQEIGTENHIAELMDKDD